MRSLTTKKMVVAAFMTALICVATMVITIPSPMQGYVNLGDGFILLAAVLLGPWYGGLSAGLGSMLADILLSYSYYAPGTLVIKGLGACLAALGYRFLLHKFPRFKTRIPAILLGGILLNLVVVLGYFGFSALLLGKGVAAVASIPGNLLQGLFGDVLGLLLIPLLLKIPVVGDFAGEMQGKNK